MIKINKIVSKINPRVSYNIDLSYVKGQNDSHYLIELL